MPGAEDHDAVVARIPVLAWLGLRHISSDDPDVHIVEMDLAERHVNMNGSPHGGVVATLIDHCGGHAAGALAGRGGPTADLHVRYLARARSGPIRAEARIVRAGRQLVVTEVRVSDGEGTLIAVGDMTTSVAHAGSARIGPSPD
jgi:uncharacterized protein (TIGR00369 family)